MMQEQYKELIQVILEKWKLILGKETVYRHVFNVPGLVVTSAVEVVEVSGDGSKAVEEVVNRFATISGTVAVAICAEAARSVLKKYPKLAVPQSIKEPDSIVQTFLKSV